MKKLLILSTLLFSQLTLADMPYISSSTSENSERVTSGDITCESRKALPTLNTGYYSSQEDSLYNTKTNNDKGAYIALSIPLSFNQRTVDCQSLYNSALQKEQLRVKQLEQQVELLKSRRFSTD